MKKWMQKLIDQFDFQWNSEIEGQTAQVELNEERATILFIIDTYNKHLVEIEERPVRKVREILDEFAKELINPENNNVDRILFRLRQFFSTYRIEEYTYFQKSFEDFRSIIWDFVDQLGEDLHQEQIEDEEMHDNLEDLREAVEANSIDDLRVKSREFIDFYTEHQNRREVRRSKKIDNFKKHLKVVKKQLNEAHTNLKLDHLTKAHNRKSFDDYVKQQWKLNQVSGHPVSMIMLDIDHFKKVNDTYGHANGDFVLIECVKLLNEVYNRDVDLVARIGGEEFCVILPDHKIEHAIKKAEKAMARIRQEVLVKDDIQIKFTVSMGIAELGKGESVDQWMKRADEALYSSKNSGRNQYTVAEATTNSNEAA